MATYRLVTVNTAPERAKRLIGIVAQELSDRYTIEHVANCETIDEVEGTLTRLRPDLVFCASMWSAEESAKIQEIAHRILPDVKTHAIPHGLQVEKGPNAIVEHLKEQIPLLLA